MVPNPDTPVTSPVTGSTVATPVLLLVQNPPVVPSLNLITEFTHTLDGPVIATGTGLTVTVAVAGQAPMEYVITAVPPGATPVTQPKEVIVATNVLLLLHVPPAVPSVRQAPEPAHILNNPVIAPGDGVVHTVVVAIQPPGNVYVIGAQPTGIPGPAP